MPFAIISALISANGAQSAAKTQANAANQATQAQLQMFNQTQANEAPYLAAGGNALQTLMQGEGLTTGQNNANVANGSLTAAFNPANLAQTPGYQFTMQQGLQALLDSQSATGGVGGGNTLKAITQYGQGLASTTYQQQLQDYMAQQQQQFSQLQTLAGSGQNAAANLGALSANVGQSVGSNIIGAGNASAAGTVGATNAATGAISNLSSNYLLSSLLGGGSGGIPAGMYNMGGGMAGSIGGATQAPAGTLFDMSTLAA
jgi:hypothetical protein